MNSFKGFSGLHPLEIAAFKKTLNNISGQGVEIGCLDGFSSTIILKYSNIVKLTSIDPIIPDSMDSSLVGSVDNILHNLHDFKERFNFVKDYSYNVVKNWKENIEFLFIDGDHSYNGCKNDYMQWEPFIKVGGLLAMHDSLMGKVGKANFHIGSTKVANEFIFSNPDKWTILEQEFSLTIAKKNK